MSTLLTVVLLAALTGTAAAAILRIRGRVPFALAALVMGAASVVVLTQLLSVPEAWNRTTMLAGQAAVALATLLAWHARGRPSPPRLGPRPTRAELMSGFRARPFAWALAGSAGLALLVQLVVGLVAPPTNWDSMTYHLSRAAHWIQNDAVGPFQGGSVRQLENPPNGEILLGWTMLMGGSDRYVELVQWTALVGIALAVFSGARMLRFAPSAAAGAASLYVLLPQPLLQAVTTQNALVDSFFMSTFVLFAVRAQRDRCLQDAVVATIGLGLALGTKGTSLIALPAVALIVAAAAVSYRPPRQFVLAAAAIGVGGVLVLAAPGYIHNLAASGSPFGALPDQIARERPVPENLREVAFHFLEAPGLGLPRIASDVQEDRTAFGLMGFFVLLPLLAGTALMPRIPADRRVLAVAALAYLVAFSILYRHTPFNARLLNPMVALGAPLLAVLATSRLRHVVLAACLASAVPALVMNEDKPLTGARTVFNLDRTEQMTSQRREMAAALEETSVRYAPDAPLIVAAGEDAWDYPFFGETLERPVTRVSGAHVSPAVLRRADAHAVIYLDVGRPRGVPVTRLGESAGFIRPLRPGR